MYIFYFLFLPADRKGARVHAEMINDGYPVAGKYPRDARSPATNIISTRARVLTDPNFIARQAHIRAQLIY